MTLPDLLTRRTFLGDKSSFLASMFAVTMIIICVLSYLLMAGPYWNITPDSYVYFMAGKNLAETGHFSVGGRPLTVVPFAYPAILAAIYSVFGGSYLVFNIFMKIMALLCIMLAFFVIRQQGLSRKAALVITLLTAFSVHMFYESTQILADIPFALFSFIAIICFGLYIRRKEYLFLSLAAIFILISYFTKTIGIALMCASLAYFYFQILRSPQNEKAKNKRILFVMLACFLIPAIAWELRSIHSGGRSLHYFRSFLESVPWVPEYATPGEIMARTIVNFIPFKLRPLVEIIGNFRAAGGVFGAGLIPITLYSVLAAMLYLGVILDVVKNKSFVGFYALTYLFIYSVMNMYGGGTRYLIPVIPFIFYYPYFFLKEILLVKKARIEKSALFRIAAAAFLLLYLFKAPAEIRRLIDENHAFFFPDTPIKYNFNPDEQELSIWLADNTDKSVICLSERHEIDSLISKRKFRYLPYTENQKDILDYIKREKIDYVIVDDNSPRVKRFLLPVIMSNKDMFESVIKKNHAGIFRVKTGGG